jgi:hypothetical protein
MQVMRQSLEHHITPQEEPRQRALLTVFATLVRACAATGSVSA